jgi:radical SAM protein with 4Fe4S-binding SPASM domain
MKLAKVYIEISNLCNLQCSFCPEVKREKKILKLEEFKKIIAAVTPFTERVTLHLMGEPLLHPEFAEFIEVLNASTLKLDLTTNGVLMKKHQQLLCQPGALRQLNFSLQSYMDNFPDRNVEDYLQTLLQYTEKVRYENPDLFINFRLWNLPMDGQVLQLPSDLLNLIHLFGRYFGVSLPNSVDVRAKKSWKLTEKIRVHWESRFVWPSLQNSSLGPNGYCYGVISQIGIHADGRVVPCCLDKEADIILGNILTMPLSEILSSERARAIVKNFEQGLACEELCQKCSFKSRFKNKVIKKVQASL